MRDNGKLIRSMSRNASYVTEYKKIVVDFTKRRHDKRCILTLGPTTDRFVFLIEIDIGAYEECIRIRFF